MNTERQMIVCPSCGKRYSLSDFKEDRLVCSACGREIPRFVSVGAVDETKYVKQYLNRVSDIRGTLSCSLVLSVLICWVLTLRFSLWWKVPIALFGIWMTWLMVKEASRSWQVRRIFRKNGYRLAESVRCYRQWYDALSNDEKDDVPSGYKGKFIEELENYVQSHAEVKRSYGTADERNAAGERNAAAAGPSRNAPPPTYSLATDKAPANCSICVGSAVGGHPVSVGSAPAPAVSGGGSASANGALSAYRFVIAKEQRSDDVYDYPPERCPGCGKLYGVADFATDNVQCRHCGKLIKIRCRVSDEEMKMLWERLAARIKKNNDMMVKCFRYLLLGLSLIVCIQIAVVGLDRYFASWHVLTILFFAVFLLMLATNFLDREKQLLKLALKGDISNIIAIEFYVKEFAGDGSSISEEEKALAEFKKSLFDLYRSKGKVIERY